MKLTSCNNCDIEFLAGIERFKNKSISCSRKCASEFKIKNSILEETCPICSTKFHLKPFHKKRFKGPFCCSRSCRGKLLETAYSGENNPHHKYIKDSDRFFAERIQAVKTRARNGNMPFNLEVQDLIDLYDKQKGLCYYTKIPMKMGSTNFKEKGMTELDVLSLDKIDPKLGYIKGNVVYCCSAINKLKGNATVQELNYFIEQLRLNYPSLKELQLEQDKATYKY